MDEFYETWKCIAYQMHRSERWCRTMAGRAEDPLPIFKVGGIVRLNAADLDQWLENQRRRSLATHHPKHLVLLTA